MMILPKKQVCRMSIGAWKKNIPSFYKIMTDRQANQPTGQPTDGHGGLNGKVHFRAQLLTRTGSVVLTVVHPSVFPPLPFFTILSMSDISNLVRETEEPFYGSHIAYITPYLDQYDWTRQIGPDDQIPQPK